jgi:hypothetical protein
VSADPDKPASIPAALDDFIEKLAQLLAADFIRRQREANLSQEEFPGDDKHG